MDRFNNKIYYTEDELIEDVESNSNYEVIFVDQNVVYVIDKNKIDWDIENIELTPESEENIESYKIKRNIGTFGTIKIII